VTQRNPQADRRATRKQPDRERVEIDYRSLAERAPSIFYRYRLLPNAAMEYINPAVADALGYSPDDFYAAPDLFRTVLDDTPASGREWDTSGSPATFHSSWPSGGNSATAARGSMPSPRTCL
jgi:PAS domain-containing protein